MPSPLPYQQIHGIHPPLGALSRVMVTAALVALAMHHPGAVTAQSPAATSMTSSPPSRSSSPIRLDGAVDPDVQQGMATLVGSYNPQQMLRLVFVLYPRNQAQLQQYGHDMQTKGSPVFHRRVSQSDFLAQFAPAAEDEQAVVDWAQAQGLTVTQRWANRLTVDAAGSVEAIQRAFNTQINAYRLGNSTFFSPASGPEVPARLSNVIRVVLGLDSRQVVQPAGLSNTQSAGLTSTPDPVYAPGPVIGTAMTFQQSGDLAAFAQAMAGKKQAAAQGVRPAITNGAYDPTDLYSSQAYDYQGLAHLSQCCNPRGNPGGSPMETSIAILGFDAVADSDVQGFVTQYPYLAKNVTYIPVNGTPQYGTANAEETTLDTEWSLALANNFVSGQPDDTSHIYVYEGADSSVSGLITELQAIGASGSAAIVSDSFFTSEAILGQASAQAIDGTLDGLVAEDGMIVVAAAGDNGPYGSNDPNNPSTCNTVTADYPASDPNVVAIGGTALHLNADGTYSSETAWTGPTTSCGFNQGGGGAGCSAYFTAQSYQQAEVAEAPCDGKRGYPDISLNASASTLQNFFFNGQLQQNAGTSIATPEFAGFLAQANSYLLSLGTICYGVECTMLGNPDYQLYAASAGAPHYPYYDITSGCDGNSAGTGYCATIGYDTATGWGSANMLQLAWDINWEILSDTGAPIIGFSGATPGTWYGHIPLAVQVTITDTGGAGTPSGVAGYSAAWDHDPGDPFNESTPGAGNSFYSGPQNPRVSSGTVNLTVSQPQGCHTLYVQAWDNMGLDLSDHANGAATQYGPICYDTTPPVVNSITFNPTSPSSASAVQVSVSASDPGASSGTGSGVATISYYVNTATDGSASGTYNLIGTTNGATGSVTWNTVGYGPGAHLIMVKVNDMAGNCDCGVPGTDDTAVYALGTSAPTPTATSSPTPCPTAVPATSSYAQTVLVDAPLGYWRLDQACTGVVNDSSGHGLGGQTEGGVTPNVPGAPLGDGDPAMRFDGSTGYVSLGDPTQLQPSQVSVEAWVNTSTTANQIVVRKRLYGYALYLNATGQPTFDINDVNAVPYTATGPTSVADGKWHYLVGTYNGQQVCLYVDGSLAGSCAAAAPIYYAPDLVAIGRDGGAADSYFNGTIDDVAIYGTALSGSRIQAHYTAASSASATATAQSRPSNTPTASQTNTPTASPTMTPTPTNTLTNTATPTNSPTRTPTATNTATYSPTSTPTMTATGTNTPTSTATTTAPSTPAPPTATLTSSTTPVPPTNSATSTPTNMPTNLPTNTPTSTPANTPTSTATSTNTPTATPLPPTPTNTALPPTTTPTNTPVPPTNTPTNTATSTSVPPTSTPTAAPAIVLSPTQISPRQTLTITGTSFGAGETIKVYLDSTTTPPFIATATKDTGTFVATGTVPPAVFGTHTVIAVGQTSHRTASATLSIKPRLTLNPTSGLPGATVKASGYGFGASETVTLHFGSATGPLLATTTSTTVGTIGVSSTVTTTVPQSQAGSYHIYAIGGHSHAQTFATFKVT